MPLCLYIPIHLYTPIHLYAPILLCASVCSQRLLHVVGGCKGLPFVLGHFHYTTPVWGAPFICTSHTQLLVPCASVCFRDISMSCGHFFLLLGVWGASVLEMSICSFLYIFVVHYVSCFYYSSNYYSSGYSGIFWPVISLTSDSGSFSDRVSNKLGLAWSGSTTTLDAERLWRCSWLSFCATAANSIFNASSGLCQLCNGFSTGRFPFQI